MSKKVGLIDKEEKYKVSGFRPPQKTSYAEKSEKDFAWAKATIDYYTRISVHQSFSTPVDGLDVYSANKQALYDAYNNKFDERIFKYVVDPLNAQDDKNKQFQARIRPYTILRPNIDLLIGEYNKRTLAYDVINKDGEESYNSFTEQINGEVNKGLIALFIQKIKELEEEGAETEEIELPEAIKRKAELKYRDAKALKGFRTLKMMEYEYRIWEEIRRSFKDYVIAGECPSIKYPLRGEVHYQRLSPLAVDGDKSYGVDYYEDGMWATARFRMTVSDIVDEFHDEIEDKQIDKLESGSFKDPNMGTFRTLIGSGNLMDRLNDKYDVIYCTWKSFKKVGDLSYPDPLTGEIQQIEVDETYIPDKELGETVEWKWISEVWHGYKVDDMYFRVEPLPIQREKINDPSYTKLSINGRRFSDTESDNISPLQLGMPFQVLYIILNWRLENMIAKNKGKIILIDKNVIPDGGSEDDPGMDEERFFYFAEAKGWALIDRNQEGVDTNYNQYTTLDMNFMDAIKEYISLMDWCKAQWDEILGITRQRKGDNLASDGKAVTDSAIFRSSVISDYLFSSFDDWVSRELEGLLDISKYAWIDGKKGYYRADDGTLQFLKVEPEELVNVDLGIYIANSAKDRQILSNIKENIRHIANNPNMRPNTVVELLESESRVEIKNALNRAEAIEKELAQSNHENAKELEEVKMNITKEFAEFEKMLDNAAMHEKADRDDNRVYVQAEADIAVEQAKVDVTAASKRLDGILAGNEDRLTQLEEASLKRRKLEVDQDKNQVKREEIAARERMNKRDNETKLKNPVVGENKKKTS